MHRFFVRILHWLLGWPSAWDQKHDRRIPKAAKGAVLIFARTRNQYIADQFARQRIKAAPAKSRMNRERRPLVRFGYYIVNKNGSVFSRGQVDAYTKSKARSIIKRRYNAKSTAGIVEWIQRAA